MSKAFIQKPAPPFSGTAVNKYGEFIDLKLSDYKGMMKSSIFRLHNCTVTPLQCRLVDYFNSILSICRKISGAVLLSPRFVSRHISQWYNLAN